MTDVRDDVMDHMAKELAADIDFELLTNLFIESGWTRIVLKPMTMERGHEIDKWIVDNCKGNHMTRGLVWVFEDTKDANWFSMRWL